VGAARQAPGRLATIVDREATKRRRARELARAAVAAGEPTAWFEELYAHAEGAESIPWAELAPNPNLLSWAHRERLDGSGRRALDIGTGLGDDAEALAGLGFEVVAFDIAQTAVAWARCRFPGSRVSFVVADLFSLPETWRGAFDFVLEAYTLQVLPAQLRPAAARAIAETLRPGGSLLAIARGRDPDDPGGEMPWPLTEQEFRLLFEPQLELLSFEDFQDDEDPPIRRFRGSFRAP
jgi:SAM-dependent methyltransferase